MLPAHATLESITASASFGHRFYTGIEMLNRLLETIRNLEPVTLSNIHGNQFSEFLSRYSLHEIIFRIKLVSIKQSNISSERARLGADVA